MTTSIKIIELHALVAVTGGKGGAGIYAQPYDPTIPVDQRIPAPYTESYLKPWQQLNPGYWGQYKLARGWHG